MSLLTERLEAYGADVPRVMDRFAGDEELYRSCLGILMEDPGFARLGEALEAGRYDEAFREAHTLKGVVGNMGLPALFEAVCQLVEALRYKAYSHLAEQYKAVLAERERVSGLLR